MNYSQTIIDGQTITLPSTYISLLSQLKFKKEIAAEYGLSSQTFCNMLKRNNLKIRNHGYLTKREMYLIYSELGWPSQTMSS
ncbi:MAG: hypothetical protein P1U56_16955 [Saprospiraceae bacterium]|nr:hypothetical protein [Saprospiraceae bacterium]